MWADSYGSDDKDGGEHDDSKCREDDVEESFPQWNLKPQHLVFGCIMVEKDILSVADKLHLFVQLCDRCRVVERVIDATQGRRTKSVIMMENGQIVLSAMQPDTIARRFTAVLLPEQEMKGDES